MNESKKNQDQLEGSTMPEIKSKGKESDNLSRDVLSSKINKEIHVKAEYGGIYLGKRFIEGKTLLLTDVKTGNDQYISDHMWVRIGNTATMFEKKFQKGDKIDILGKVIKYKKAKVKSRKLATDYSIEIIDANKDE
jgi:hypothetical protein